MEKTTALQGIQRLNLIPLDAQVDIESQNFKSFILILALYESFEVNLLSIAENTIEAMLLLDYLVHCDSLQNFDVVCRAAAALIPPQLRGGSTWSRIQYQLIQISTQRSKPTSEA